MATKITQKKVKTGTNTYTDLIPDCASRSIITLTSAQGTYGPTTEANQILTLAREAGEQGQEAPFRKAINNILASKNTGKYGNIFYDETTGTLKFWEYMATIMKTVPTKQSLLDSPVTIGTSTAGTTVPLLSSIVGGDVIEIWVKNTADVAPTEIFKGRLKDLNLPGLSSISMTEVSGGYSEITMNYIEVGGGSNSLKFYPRKKMKLKTASNNVGANVQLAEAITYNSYIVTNIFKVFE